MTAYEVTYVIEGVEIVNTNSPEEAEELVKEIIFETYDGFGMDIDPKDIRVEQIVDLNNGRNA